MLSIVEFSTITKDEEGNVVYHVFTKAELKALLDEAAEKGIQVSGDKD